MTTPEVGGGHSLLEMRTKAAMKRIMEMEHLNGTILQLLIPQAWSNDWLSRGSIVLTGVGGMGRCCLGMPEYTNLQCWEN